VSTQLSERELQIVFTHTSLNEKYTSSSTLVSRRQRCGALEIRTQRLISNFTWKQGRNQLFISGGSIFVKFHSMTSSYLSNHGTTFSQTVIYNNNAFLPTDTKSIVYKHTHSTQGWFIKTERFTTALEAESAVSSEISDFTPYAHAQSNFLCIKYAEKTDGCGGCGV